jgi:ATP-dependent RNA helicase DHX37/DHR1
MLYEAGYTNIIEDGVTCARRIAITQPRRVAAVSMAVRVGEELAEPSTSHLVAHHIRFDTSVDAASRIVFMTDGVLLRHMQNDIALDRCV